MKTKRFIKLLILALSMLLAAALLGSCSQKSDQDIDGEDEDIMPAGDYYVIAYLPSDVENGFVWDAEQSEELFSVDTSFIQDDSYQGEGTGQEQILILRPVSKGDTVVTFTGVDTDGTQYVYTYAISLDDDLQITLGDSSGTVNGADSDAPLIYVEAE